MDLSDYHPVDGALLLVDFRKAFDSLSWEFLHYALETFGFGSNFQCYVEMYKNISSTVINNGNTTKYFNLQCGISKGCPVSAYLFILCVELLATRIRELDDFRGLVINDHIYKFLQFADDTVLVARNKRDIAVGLHILQEFGKCSGLVINKD